MKFRVPANDSSRFDRGFVVPSATRFLQVVDQRQLGILVGSGTKAASTLTMRDQCWIRREMRSTRRRVTDVRSRRTRPRLSAMLTVCALFLGAPLLAQQSGDIAELSTTLEALSERVRPGVVQIFATGYTPGPGGRAVERSACRSAAGERFRRDRGSHRLHRHQRPRDCQRLPRAGRAAARGRRNEKPSISLAAQGPDRRGAHRRTRSRNRLGRAEG